jgi:hypothetical protein
MHNGGAARGLGQLRWLRNVIANDFHADTSPAASSPAVRLRSPRLADQQLALRPGRQLMPGGPPPVTRWPEKPVHHPRRLGNRADNGDRTRWLTAGDVQLSRRGAGHVPGLHERAAAGHAVGAWRQRQLEPAVPACRGRERLAGGSAAVIVPGSGNGKPGAGPPTRTNLPGTVW